jgi:S-adenosylmethionine-diacylglycerol 3-amino-3-carboxypropyl transferase
MLHLSAATQRATATRLAAAVHRNRMFSREGVLERIFTLAFRGLVYPQIWEDPAIDLEAMQIRPTDHVLAIGSGGCNILNYLVADPARISAIDLNGAHIALIRLKLCALRHLPDYDTFFRFFGSADCRGNLVAYERYIKPHLDLGSRRYWEARTVTGRRRIESFTRNFYRYGLLGRCIGMGHLLARLYGCNPRNMLAARSLQEQRAIFDRELAPIFDKRFVRWLFNQPAALYGLGIPPSQHRALAGAKPDGMARVLQARVERLACDFDLNENYFASQAFGRRYQTGADAPLPPYLERRNYDAIKNRCERIGVFHVSMTEYLQRHADRSIDCFVLLDAQDWMTGSDLALLWGEITRTAKAQARVIFRTAAEKNLLFGRVPSDILARWRYEEDHCRDLTQRDRSSIYGGFHLHSLREDALRDDG